MIDLDRILDLLVLAGLGAIGYLLRSLKAYAKEKGRNLATREDIAEIAREVESVKSEYSERLENLAQQNRLLLELTKQQHELRMAALDRRLAAHQEAYALWWKLMGVVHDKNEVGKVVEECQTWFVNNRLYLEPEVAAAFGEAYHAAFNHRDYVEARDPSIDIKANWQTIQSLGEVIVKTVKLPSLREKEYAPVDGASDEQGVTRRKRDA